MPDACQEIRNILIRNDRTISWLSGKMRIPRSTLNARLNNPETFSKKDYDKIFSIFKKENMVSDVCERLEKETLAIDSIMASSITLLNTTVLNFVSDNELTFKEKESLLKHIETTKKQLNEQLDLIAEIVER